MDPVSERDVPDPKAIIRPLYLRANRGEDVLTELPAALAAVAPRPFTGHETDDLVGLTLALQARLQGMRPRVLELIFASSIEPECPAFGEYVVWTLFGRANLPRCEWKWGDGHSLTTLGQALVWSHGPEGKGIRQSAKHFAEHGAQDPSVPTELLPDMHAVLGGRFLEMQAKAGHPFDEWIKTAPDTLASPGMRCARCVKLGDGYSDHLTDNYCPSENVEGLVNLGQLAFYWEGDKSKLQTVADKVVICPRCLSLYRVSWDCEPFVMDVDVARVSPAQVDALFEAQPWVYMQ